MLREEAEQLVKELMKNENLIKHLYSVEAVMRGLAKKFNEDENLWGLVGLLHDADYELTKDDPHKHTLLLVERLQNYDIADEIIHAIKAHNRRYTLEEPQSNLDWALICADDLAGLIIATALVMSDKKLASVKAESILKKFKDKSFARGVDRNRIIICEEKLNIPLEEFIKISLEALQRVSAKLGL